MFNNFLVKHGEKCLLTLLDKVKHLPPASQKTFLREWGILYKNRAGTIDNKVINLFGTTNKIGQTAAQLGDIMPFGAGGVADELIGLAGKGLQVGSHHGTNVYAIARNNVNDGFYNALNQKINELGVTIRLKPHTRFDLFKNGNMPEEIFNQNYPGWLNLA